MCFAVTYFFPNQKTLSLITSMQFVAAAGIKSKLDAIDEVRKKLLSIGHGATFQDEILNHLPQFVACGAQSAGKSSIIRRVTGIALPEASGCCTRIATMIQLRKSADTVIKVELIADTSFKEGPTTTTELVLTDLAQVKRCVADFQEEALQGRNFIDNCCIAIKYSAPNNVNLTLVDLPGFHNADDNDTAMVDGLVQKYIQMDGTLCLHVVKGDQDYDSVLGNGSYANTLYDLHIC